LPIWFTEHIIQDFDYGDDDDDGEDVGRMIIVDSKEEAVKLGNERIAPGSADDRDEDEPTQAVFSKDMTIDDHTQESVLGAHTPLAGAKAVLFDKTKDYTWDKNGKTVVKDEDYYDY
jgi:hypothetical protein